MVNIIIKIIKVDEVFVIILSTLIQVHAFDDLTFLSYHILEVSG